MPTRQPTRAQPYFEPRHRLRRMEHMFFDGERIVAVREMILCDTEAGRRVALAEPPPMQRSATSSDLSKIMAGIAGQLPRLICCCMICCAPRRRPGSRRGYEDRRGNCAATSRGEVQPMLGHRGCRRPFLSRNCSMQARLFRGGCRSRPQGGAAVVLELMVDLAASRQELELRQGARIDAVAAQVMERWASR